MIDVRDVGHTYDSNGGYVLSGVSFRFSQPTLAAILGPSGCGKTTLLRCIAGLLHPTTGSVNLEGLDPVTARRMGRVGFAFQAPTLLPWRTALENVQLPLEILGRDSRDEARRALGLVDLEEDAGKLPRELSGGMQQRVNLARALVTNPTHVLLDEPFGALDGITRERLSEKVRELWEAKRMTMIFVTHSIEEATFLAEKVFILAGRPAPVRRVIDIDLPSPRTVHTRGLKEFFDYQKVVREAIE